MSSTIVPSYVDDIADLTSEILQVISHEYPNANKLCSYASSVMVPYLEYFTDGQSSEDHSDCDDDDKVTATPPEVNVQAVTNIVTAYEKMVDLSKGQLYRSGTFAPDVSALSNALSDMNLFLEEKGYDVDDIFDSFVEEDDVDFDSDDDDEANARRAKCQYEAFLGYLSRQDMLSVHREFMEWLPAEIEAGRHPPVQCIFRPSVMNCKMFRFRPK